MPDNRSRRLLSPQTAPAQRSLSWQPLVDPEDADETGGPDAAVSGYVHSAETTGTVNGPGVRYTLFMSGCPLRCLYCHNPDTWQMRMGTRTTVQSVIDDIAPYRTFIEATGGGFTTSGGEPLLQPRFLSALYRQVKEQLGGMHIALDTSGFLGENATDELLGLTDLVLLDIKSGDAETYRQVTGVDLAPTLEFARRLSRLGNATWVRFVLVPGLTDAPENVAAVADFVAGLATVERVEILPYHEFGRHKYAALGLDSPLEGTTAPSPEEVEVARATFRERGLTVF